MDFRRLELKDAVFFQKFFAADKTDIGDFSFVNLFIWRHQRVIEFCETDGCLIIKTTPRDENPYYFFPFGAGDKRRALMNLKNHAQILNFRALTNENLAILRDVFGDFVAVEERDRSDYVYKTAELITLAGRRFHKKKNHLNGFLKAHPDFRYEKITLENTKIIAQKQEEWFAAHPEGTENSGLFFENCGILDVLLAFPDLATQNSIRGGAIFVQDLPVAFSVGEILHENMALIHVEKADPKIPGAYQIINQQFLEHEFFAQEFVNREEDLGLPGLRKAKMSYNPAYLIPKFNAKI